MLMCVQLPTTTLTQTAKTFAASRVHTHLRRWFPHHHGDPVEPTELHAAVGGSLQKVGMRRVHQPVIKAEPDHLAGQRFTGAPQGD